MLGLIVFLSCTGVCAWRLASLLAVYEPEPLTRVERSVWTGVFMLGLWLAQGYLLSFVAEFRAGALLGVSLLLLALTGAATHRQPLGIAEPWRFLVAGLRRFWALGLHQPVDLGTVLPLGLVSLCVIYSAAALWLLPVGNHDALSYHFPKAVLLMTTRAFGLYATPDLRITYFPGNYELLVATILTFVRSDRLTGLITSASVSLLLASSFVLFKRVWRETSPAILALPMLLASPVVFLHVTAHKNDLLMAAVTFNALIWLGRYAVRGGTGSAIVGVVSMALAVGTKFHGLFLVLASTVLFWRAWRSGVWRPTPAAAAGQALCAAAAFTMLGGAQYILNVVSTGHPTGILQIATPNAVNTVAYPAYWQVPRFVWMFLAAPVLSDGQYFIVPWSGETWYWPAYELYFSHYGIHVSLLIVLLPLGVWWTRRQLEPSIWTELCGVSVAAAILVFFNLLIGLRPYGSFAFIPRFLFFALPVLLVWTWCPGVRYFLRIRSWTWLPLVASLAISTAYIGIAVTKDRFSPIADVEMLWRFPDRRREIFVSPLRAASHLDELAPADATVAVDSGYDGWTYPAYGERLSRKVEIIVNQPGPYLPGPEVDWVAVDRGFSIIWGHPDFQRMSQARRYLDGGPLSVDDRRVYDSLIKNPEFKRVYFYQGLFQAVFQRVRPGHAAASGVVGAN